MLKNHFRRWILNSIIRLKLCTKTDTKHQDRSFFISTHFTLQVCFIAKAYSWGNKEHIVNKDHVSCFYGRDKDHGSIRTFGCLCIQHYFVGKQIYLRSNKKSMWS